MTFHDKKTSFAALAVGALVALTPATSEAATIRIQDLSGGASQDIVVNDTGNITQAGVAAGTFLDGTNTMSTTVVATPSDDSSVSALNSISVTTTGVGKIRIITSEDEYGAGAGASLISDLAFSITSSQLPVSIFAQSFVDDGDAIEAESDQIGGDLNLTGPASPGTLTAMTSDTALLTNPFSITSVFEIEHTTVGQITSFDAQVTATPVPLPAAGWLMIAGLGGLAALRRRKRAA